MLSEARQQTQDAADIFSGAGDADDARDCPPGERRQRKQWRATGVEVPLKEVTIGGHKITCVNLAQKIALKVDARSHAFLAEYVEPLMRNVIRQLAKNSKHEKAFVGSSPPAPFSFDRSPMPNIRDKLTWDPMKFAWKVMTRDAKGKGSTVFLTVDRDLASKPFADMKTTKYREAVQLWNGSDKSTRQRIPDLLPVVPAVAVVGLDTQDA